MSIPVIMYLLYNNGMKNNHLVTNNNISFISTGSLIFHHMEADRKKTPPHTLEQGWNKHVHKAPPDCLNWRKSHHTTLDTGHHNPNMYRAQYCKQNSSHKWKGNCKDRCEKSVQQKFCEFKNCITANPHFIKAVSCVRFCNNIFKIYLWKRKSHFTSK